MAEALPDRHARDAGAQLRCGGARARRRATGGDNDGRYLTRPGKAAVSLAATDDTQRADEAALPGLTHSHESARELAYMVAAALSKLVLSEKTVSVHMSHLVQGAAPQSGRAHPAGPAPQRPSSRLIPTDGVRLP
jgi:hypothetical protein